MGWDEVGYNERDGMGLAELVTFQSPPQRTLSFFFLPHYPADTVGLSGVG